jgi:FKBP-type peptidyl-prolyl cis-trans isomerase
MRQICFALLLSLPVFAHAQTGDTVITPTGLRYIVLYEGSGVRPNAGQKVTVMYVGMFMDGKVFDESVEPFKYVLGDKGIIPGWNEGLLFMPEGSKFRFIIPAQWAYGDKGVRNADNPNQYDIPPGADLMFDIDLLRVR